MLVLERAREHKNKCCKDLKIDYQSASHNRLHVHFVFLTRLNQSSKSFTQYSIEYCRQQKGDCKNEMRVDDENDVVGFNDKTQETKTKNLLSHL